MLFAIGISYVILAMVRERARDSLRAAAYSDPLTGIENRRAFMEGGEQLLRECAARRMPVTLLLCDLDHLADQRPLRSPQGGRSADCIRQRNGEPPAPRRSVRTDSAAKSSLACCAAATPRPMPWRSASAPGCRAADAGARPVGGEHRHRQPAGTGMRPVTAAVDGRPCAVCAKQQGRSRVLQYAGA
jgi:hypothetical protein